MRTFLRLSGLLFPLLLVSSALAETVFYQPQPTDEAVSRSQWQQIWRQAQALGYDSVVFQWSEDGQSDYLGWPRNDERAEVSAGQAWFREAIRAANDAGMQVILGLYSEPGMSQTLAGDDSIYYLHYLLSHSRLQMEKARAWDLAVSEWFIPLDVEDRHLRRPDLLAEVVKQISSLKRLTDLPVSLTVISSGLYTPERFAEWLQVLSEAGLRLWWRPSNTVSLPALVQETYLQQMGCGVGIIRSQADLGLASSEAWQACHRHATPDLRTLPGMTALSGN